MVKNFVNLFLILIVFGCSAQAKGNQVAPYEKYVNEIIRSFSKEMEKEYGLTCSGSGGRMPQDVEQISIFFDANRHATIDEARELFIAVTEKLVNKINQHEKIRPYLREFPFTLASADKIFTWCRAHISISFLRDDGSHYTDGSVAYISQGKRGVYYCSAEIQKRKGPNFIDFDGTVEIGKVTEDEVLIDLIEEPLEEALKIVQENRTTKNIANLNE